jgi:hypothetical protein
MAQLRVQITNSSGKWYVREVEDDDRADDILKQMIEREGYGNYRFELKHSGQIINGAVSNKKILGLISTKNNVYNS